MLTCPECNGTRIARERDERTGFMMVFTCPHCLGSGHEDESADEPTPPAVSVPARQAVPEVVSIPFGPVGV